MSEMLVRYERDEVELDIPDAVEIGVVQSRLRSFTGIPSEAVAVKVGQGHKSVGRLVVGIS